MVLHRERNGRVLASEMTIYTNIIREVPTIKVGSDLSVIIKCIEKRLSEQSGSL